VAAGQTLPHLPLQIIPRSSGDVPDPRGGIRNGLPNPYNKISLREHSAVLRSIHYVLHELIFLGISAQTSFGVSVGVQVRLCNTHDGRRSPAGSPPFRLALFRCASPSCAFRRILFCAFARHPRQKPQRRQRGIGGKRLSSRTSLIFLGISSQPA
jgi:hypothetical protein